jgi:hypothetical protein
MDKQQSTVVIKLSKKKIAFYFFLALLFIIIGILLIISPDHFISPLTHDHGVIESFGFAGVLIFGFAAIFLFKKIIDKKSGLVISPQGIYDNSAASAVGLIEWKDILSINILDQDSAKGVIIKVEDENKYLSRIKNRVIKYNMKSVAKWYDSPFIITAGNLKTDNERLQKIIIQNFELYKNNK